MLLYHLRLELQPNRGHTDYRYTDNQYTDLCTRIDLRPGGKLFRDSSKNDNDFNALAPNIQSF